MEINPYKPKLSQVEIPSSPDDTIIIVWKYEIKNIDSNAIADIHSDAFAFF